MCSCPQTILLADPQSPNAAVCRGPHDDYLVALAKSSGAEAIVTGDLDLLALDPGLLGIDIITPQQLVGRLS